MATEHEDFTAALDSLLDDDMPVTLMLTAAQAFAVMAMLQLALRHPSSNGFTGQAVRPIAEALAAEFGRRNEALGRLAHRGFLEVFDMPRKGPLAVEPGKG